MEAIENLHRHRVYTYGKAAATVATAGVSYVTGSLAAAVSAVGLSILFASQKLTAAFQPKSLLSHSFMKLALSAALATIVALAYLSIAGVPLVAAEVAYIASLFLIPTLAEICIEAASVALSTKKISLQTKTSSNKTLIEWMNQRDDYRDTEVEKAENRETEIIEEHSPLPLLLKDQVVSVEKQRGVEWEAYQAIEALENEVINAIENWKKKEGRGDAAIYFVISKLDLLGFSENENDLAELNQEVNKMVIDAVTPLLERGSIYALFRLNKRLTPEILRSVEEQYKGLHLYSYYLGKVLAQSGDDQPKAEIRKILRTLAEKGFLKAMKVLIKYGEDLGFKEEFIESCRRRLMDSNAQFREEHSELN